MAAGPADLDFTAAFLPAQPLHALQTPGPPSPAPYPCAGSAGHRSCCEGVPRWRCGRCRIGGPTDGNARGGVPRPTLSCDHAPHPCVHLQTAGTAPDSTIYRGDSCRLGLQVRSASGGSGRGSSAATAAAPTLRMTCPFGPQRLGTPALAHLSWILHALAPPCWHSQNPVIEPSLGSATAALTHPPVPPKPR